MRTVNKVTLLGHLGADPKITTFSNGGRVATLSVATNDSWRDRNTGERREKTEWHRVAVYSEAAVAYCERYLRKGMKVYVEGTLETRKWTDQNNIERYMTEIVIRPYRGEINGLDRRDDGADTRNDGPFDEPRSERPSANGHMRAGYNRPGSSGAPNGTRSNFPKRGDDLPF